MAANQPSLPPNRERRHFFFHVNSSLLETRGAAEPRTRTRVRVADGATGADRRVGLHNAALDVKLIMASWGVRLAILGHVHATVGRPIATRLARRRHLTVLIVADLGAIGSHPPRHVHGIEDRVPIELGNGRPRQALVSSALTQPASASKTAKTIAADTLIAP